MTTSAPHLCYRLALKSQEILLKLGIQGRLWRPKFDNRRASYFCRLYLRSISTKEDLGFMSFHDSGQYSLSTRASMSLRNTLFQVLNSAKSSVR